MKVGNMIKLDKSAERGVLVYFCVSTLYKGCMEKENRRINTEILKGWTIICGVLLIAYTLELVKKSRTPGYFALFVTLDLVPLIIAWLIYKKNKADARLRYLCAIFYTVLYVFVLLTGATPMVFTYIFPMLYLLMLCNDVKLIVGTGITMIVANLVCIIVQITVQKKSLAENLAEWEIQIAASILCTIFAFLSARLSAALYKERMRVVEENGEHLEKIMAQVVTVSDVVKENLNAMNGELDALENASEKTASAMNEIVSGTIQSTEMVEKQLKMTADIQEIIERANRISDEISGHVTETEQKVEDGITNMKKLFQSATGVEQNSRQVTEHMRLLRDTTEEVQSIVTIIDGIAEQTNLLALNASIEAARAGEAGRGFAVVAGEINGLATQTQSATQNITKMVSTLKQNAEEALSAVGSMTELNKEQNEIIYATDGMFGQIRQGMKQAKANTDTEIQCMSELMSANAQIVESVHTVSAVSEEVMSNTAETQEIAHANRDAAERVAKYAKELGERVEELRSYVI